MPRLPLGLDHHASPEAHRVNSIPNIPKPSSSDATPSTSTSMDDQSFVAERQVVPDLSHCQNLPGSVQLWCPPGLAGSSAAGVPTIPMTKPQGSHPASTLTEPASTLTTLTSSSTTTGNVDASQTPASATRPTSASDVAAGASTKSSTTGTETASPSGGNHKALYIGVSIGAALLISLILLVGCFLLNRRHRKKRAAQAYSQMRTLNQEQPEQGFPSSPLPRPPIPPASSVYSPAPFRYFSPMLFKRLSKNVDGEYSPVTETSGRLFHLEQGSSKGSVEIPLEPIRAKAPQARTGQLNRGPSRHAVLGKLPPNSSARTAGSVPRHMSRNIDMPSPRFDFLGRMPHPESPSIPAPLLIRKPATLSGFTICPPRFISHRRTSNGAAPHHITFQSKHTLSNSIPSLATDSEGIKTGSVSSNLPSFVAGTSSNRPSFVAGTIGECSPGPTFIGSERTSRLLKPSWAKGNTIDETEREDASDPSLRGQKVESDTGSSTLVGEESPSMLPTLPSTAYVPPLPRQLQRASRGNRNVREEVQQWELLSQYGGSEQQSSSNLPSRTATPFRSTSQGQRISPSSPQPAATFRTRRASGSEGIIAGYIEQNDATGGPRGISLYYADTTDNVMVGTSERLQQELNERQAIWERPENLEVVDEQDAFSVYIQKLELEESLRAGGDEGRTWRGRRGR